MPVHIHQWGLSLARNQNGQEMILCSDHHQVIMVAPKCPGTEVREEFKRGFGVPTLIAVHPATDPSGSGLATAKAYAAGLGSDRAGVLESSFVAEVNKKSSSDQSDRASSTLWRERHPSSLGHSCDCLRVFMPSVLRSSQGQVGPNGRADHPLRHAPDRVAALL